MDNLNLTHEQMAIYKDVEKGKKSSPKNIIIKSILKDLSNAREEIERLKGKDIETCHYCDDIPVYEGWHRTVNNFYSTKMKVCEKHKIMVGRIIGEIDTLKAEARKG